MRRILDPHIHWWSPTETPRRASPLAHTFGRLSPALAGTAANLVVPPAALAFVGDPAGVLGDYLPLHYGSDAAAFDLRGVVHVEADWRGGGALGPAAETRWLEGIGGAHLRAVVAGASLDSRRLPALLDAHRKASPRLRGIRHKLAAHSDRRVMSWARADLLDDPRWRRGYASLGDAGLSFDAWVYAEQLPALARVIGAHPATAVVLDHLGTPVGVAGPHRGVGQTAAERAQLEAQWWAGLEAVATHPHVHVKLSGLTMPVVGFGFERRGGAVSAGEIAERVGPWWRRAIELFGAERCMFASNFPMDRVSVRFEALWTAFLDVVADLPEPQIDALVHDNAARFYRLDPEGTAR